MEKVDTTLIPYLYNWRGVCFHWFKTSCFKDN